MLNGAGFFVSRLCDKSECESPANKKRRIRNPNSNILRFFSLNLS